MADETKNDAAVDEAPASKAADPADALQTVEEASPEEAKAKAKVLREAQATDDPNDDLVAARPEEGRDIAVPAAVVEAAEPDEPTVKVRLVDSFVVPVLEEYEDEQGRPRGRVAGYEAPSDVRISVASFDPDKDKDFVDEDGYVALDGVVELPQHIANQVLGSPAVEVAE